jgi:alkylated DNA repair dioxygenase AlkB
MSQLDLFAVTPQLPDGLIYQPDFVSGAEERDLLNGLAAVEYAEIRMHGVIAKRRAAHFGLDYEYQSAAVAPGPPIPDFLLPLRQRIAAFAGRRPEEFVELLITEYPTGAGIGWHRDAPAFEIIAGLSLLSPCTMQFRPWPVESTAGTRRKPLALTLEPRSLYIIRGPSRTSWQHHIPTAKSRRISLTFRTVRPSAR